MDRDGEGQGDASGGGASGPVRVRSREEFARALGDARARSGMSVRKLGKLLDVPSSTIHGWFTGRHLPYPRDDDLFRRVLKAVGVDDTEVWWEALDRLRRGRSPTESPYRGLESYGREHADVFFGRTRLAEQAVEVISAARSGGGSAAPGLAFLIGASGSGKSSLLHAGIQPRLERAGCTVAALRPGADPGEAWTAVANPVDTVLIDQFEELFTQATDAERREFTTTLGEWCARPGHVAVGAVRADFFADLVAGPLAAGLAHQVFIGPMTWPELEECIVEPARARQLLVDDDLLAALRKDFVPERDSGATHARGALPLLSHVLWRISETSSVGRLTAADYVKLGGLEGTVEQAAEEVYAALDDESREAWHRFVPLLVSVDADGTVARRLVTPEQAAHVAAREEGLDAALAALVDARLVTVSADGVELTHEAVLSAWPRLRTSIDENRAVLALRSELSQATRVWVDHDRDPSALASGVRLARLEPWADSAYRYLLTPDEAAFVGASHAQAADAEHRQRRGRRNLRRLAGVTTVMALIAAALAVVAYRSAADARNSRDAAQSRQIALRADTIRAADPVLAGQLALAAFQLSPTAEARSSVLEAAVAPRATRLLGGPGATPLAVSPDGALLAFGSEADSLIQLVSRSDEGVARRGVIHLDEGVVSYAMAFSADGTALAVGSSDGAVRWWEVGDPDAPAATGTPITGLAGPVFGIGRHDDDWAIAAAGEPARLVDRAGPMVSLAVAEPRAVVIAPAGWSVVGGADGSVTIWDAAGDRLSQPAEAGGSEVTSVAVSPDGGLLAAGTKGRELFVWSVADPARPQAVDGVAVDFTSWVNAVAFSPDGETLAAGSSDRTVRVWSTGDWAVAGGYELPDAVTGVAYLPDGSLATTVVDGSLRIWDDVDRTDARLGSNIWTGAYAADSSRFAAFGDTAAVWDTTDPAHPRLLGAGIAPGFEMSGAGTISPDGSTLAIGGSAGEVALVDVTDPANPRPIGETTRDATGLIEYLAYLHDGAVLAVGGDDGAVRFYDLSTPDGPRLLGRPYTVGDSIVFAFATDPVEHVMAVTGSDDSVHLVDISDPAVPSELAVVGGFGSDTTGIAISPDGTALAAASNDEYILFWDISDPSAPKPLGERLEGPHATPFTLDWSADGRTLAASATDHSVWLWNVEDPRHPWPYAELESPGGPVHVASISPDDATVAGAGADATVRFWPLDVAAAATELCRAAGDTITADEWAAYLPRRAFDSPCTDRR